MEGRGKKAESRGPGKLRGDGMETKGIAKAPGKAGGRFSRGCGAGGAATDGERADFSGEEDFAVDGRGAGW